MVYVDVKDSNFGAGLSIEEVRKNAKIISYQDSDEDSLYDKWYLEEEMTYLIQNEDGKNISFLFPEKKGR